jgi:site-specific recombinase
MELFIEAGISHQDSFWAEFFKRLNEKFLPQPPRTRELADLLHRNFREPRDAEWIRLLDAKTFTRILELLHFEEGQDLSVWHILRGDVESALILLSYQVKGLGLSPLIRQRLDRFAYKDLPFYQLPDWIEKSQIEKDPDLRIALSDKIEKTIQNSFLALYEVHQHMDEYGVSVQIVYQIERMELMLGRIRDLNFLLRNETVEPTSLAAFIEVLISQNSERHSLRALFSDNFSLLARKIAERTAETGEHYITRNKAEYLAGIKSAVGGGFLTSFTTLIKFLVTSMGLTPFFAGLGASLNYAISFLGMHFAHFSLGTKQPSATAAALAAKMHGIRNPEALDSLIDEIVDLIRSQIAAVTGNIIGVLPVTILVAWAWQICFGKTLIGTEKALHVLQDFSILGPTPLYAAFTGVLLWLSSVISGWVDNWFAFHQLASALSHNRRLASLIGDLRARQFALFMKKNMSAIGASVSLGFLLGMSPVILQFFGIPLDVRHVTLSTGALAMALTSLPKDHFPTLDLWLAVSGILAMGVLNILVSFSLALLVAIRARKIQAPERNLIYRALLIRLKQRPLSLFWPL